MIKFILLWIWQLPQNIAGFILSLFSDGSRLFYLDKKWRKVYFHKLNPKTWGEAVTLGEYIFLDSQWYKDKDPVYVIDVVSHEYGHTKQSRILGWFYFLVIGLPSIIHAAIHNHTCRGKEYEHFYTERWADKLGGVEK